MLIDKTDRLEKCLAEFPSLFIEGAAACGKTTAVNMLLNAHPEMTSDVFYMDKENDIETFCQRLGRITAEAAGERFFVFENMNGTLDSAFYEAMADLVERVVRQAGGAAVEIGGAAAGDSNIAAAKVIFVSREKPPAELLNLLWQGKMGMIYPASLMLTQKEVATLVHKKSSALSTDELYLQTGGWPGCVSMLIRTAEQLEEEKPTIAQLLERYEVRAYLQTEILDTLGESEQAVLAAARLIPWITPGIPLLRGAGREPFDDLQRKGLLTYNEKKKYWRLNRLFKSSDTVLDEKYGLEMGQWYEERRAVNDALWCYDRAGCRDEYRRCVIENFNVVPFELLAKSDVMEWKGGGDELSWLRGMYCYLHHDFSGMGREMQKVGNMKGPLAAEVYLNLAFANPEMGTVEWLDLLEERGRECAPVRLYHFCDNSNVLLTGLRELSDIFVCSAREEKRRMKLLRELLGEREWEGVQLARVDFDFETIAKGVQEKEQWQSVLRIAGDDTGTYSWQYKAGCLYLLNKIHITYGEPTILELMMKISDQLKWEDDEVCRKYFHTTMRSHDLWGSGEDKGTRWLRDSVPDATFEVTEENYFRLFLQVKGYLQLNQYEHAGRILDRLIPYVQQYHRNRMMAELLFQQAIVDWAKGRKGAALQSIIASFLYTGDCHYVVFYVSYGRGGREVLEMYLEWLRNSEPKKWQRKKKYNYGSVLKMPREDYLEVVLRLAKRSAKGVGGATDIAPAVESLTMTETMVLQNINKGLSNAGICEALNMKLPTVKTHISNIYKKLGVTSRVQAIVKGKELGILK